MIQTIAWGEREPFTEVFSSAQWLVVTEREQWFPIQDEVRWRD